MDPEVRHDRLTKEQDEVDPVLEQLSRISGLLTTPSGPGEDIASLFGNLQQAIAGAGIKAPSTGASSKPSSIDTTSSPVVPPSTSAAPAPVTLNPPSKVPTYTAQPTAPTVTPTPTQPTNSNTAQMKSLATPAVTPAIPMPPSSESIQPPYTIKLKKSNEIGKSDEVIVSLPIQEWIHPSSGSSRNTVTKYSIGDFDVDVSERRVRISKKNVVELSSDYTLDLSEDDTGMYAHIFRSIYCLVGKEIAIDIPVTIDVNSTRAAFNSKTQTLKITMNRV